MAKGGDNPPTQTTTQQLSPEQRQIMDLAMPGIQSYAAHVPQRYQGEQVQGFDPSQIQGQDMALANVDRQNQIGADAQDAYHKFASGNIWDPTQNPNLQGAIDAATRPIMQNYSENILPGIRGDSVSTGNFGSSRQGVAEGIAARGASQAVGDTASKLVQDQYDTNVKAQLQALGLAPQVQEDQLAGAKTTSGVGDVRQALAQARTSEAAGNWNYDQLAPFLQSQQLMAMVQGLPGGSVTTTGSTPNQPVGANQILGGAATGAAVGSALFPGVGTAVGAAGGAALPFLMNRLG